MFCESPGFVVFCLNVVEPGYWAAYLDVCSSLFSSSFDM